MTRGDPSTVREVRKDRVEGRAFGHIAYTLYETYSPEQESESPYLYVWLHGQDNAHLEKQDIDVFRQRLGRRLFCLVPRNPVGGWDGRRFFWGLGFTREQNRKGLGFVFGEFCDETLDALGGLVQRIAKEVGALGVMACGYSMGGFGALQLGSRSPKLFNAVAMVAGHGLGTLEPDDTDSRYGAPQPESSRIFKDYLAEHAPSLANVRRVIAIHAQRDTVSSFWDAEAIVKAIQRHGGNAELVQVPDEKADSDLSRGKSRTRRGHSYYNYALLNDSSEDVLYSRLKGAFSRVKLVAKAPTPDTQVRRVGRFRSERDESSESDRVQVRRVGRMRSERDESSESDRVQVKLVQASKVPDDAKEWRTRRGRWRSTDSEKCGEGRNRSRSPPRWRR